MMIRCLMMASLALAAVPALAQQGENVPLKPGSGLDTVTTTCSTCHTLNYIRMNSVFLSPDAWKAEVTKMREGYGAPFDAATGDTIVKYLTENYAAK
jgi:mono/diheme cytochrome c family protein